jgi:hypothetical protein
MKTRKYAESATTQHRKLINLVRLFGVTNHCNCLVISRKTLSSLLGITRLENGRKQQLIEDLSEEGFPYTEEWSMSNSIDFIVMLGGRCITSKVPNRNQFAALIVSTAPLNRDSTPEDYEYGQEFRLGVFDLQATMLAHRIVNYQKEGLSILDELNRHFAAGIISIEEFRTMS